MSDGEQRPASMERAFGRLRDKIDSQETGMALFNLSNIRVPSTTAWGEPANKLPTEQIDRNRRELSPVRRKDGE
jgi:hypothetical protein